MYATATIEPRLIALLNDTSPEPFIHSHLDLPPLQDPAVHKSQGRPSPLEPQAGIRRDKSTSLAVKQTLSFDRDANHNALTATSSGNKSSHNLDRALGGTSPQSLRKILDDVPGSSQSPASKKRQRTESTKDDFVQLPQPPKKQKAAQQVVPPIIIGLFEPPPNAALFPPISSSAFHDSHGRNSLNVGPLDEAKESAPNKLQAHGGEETRRERTSCKTSDLLTRKKRKWAEAETTHLLLGVKKHGLGNWTKILQDSEFKFDGRRAVDLKDRFRTCCPDELREAKKSTFSATKSGDDTRDTVYEAKPSSLEKVVGDSGIFSREDSNAEERIFTTEETISSYDKAHNKSRTHRKKVEDLVQLGINEPFRKSRRRERRPFSDEEDRNILRGYELYGASWSSIQKDTRFGLGARRPTDLRDRLRNKYPEKFRSEDDARKATKEISAPTVLIAQAPSSSQASDLLSGQDRAQVQPQTIPQDSKTRPKAVALLPPPSSQLKDIFADLLDQPTTNEATESLSFSQFDWGEGMAPYQGSLGEMDISRILLDDSDNWSTPMTSIQVRPKQSFTDISSICTTTETAPNQFLPTYNMS